jgi:hypothetical protein
MDSETANLLIDKFRTIAPDEQKDLLDVLRWMEKGGAD